MHTYKGRKLVLVLMVLTLFIYGIKPLIIDGTSMEPTIQDNSWVYINRYSYTFNDPSKGDIILFTHPKFQKKYFIKRIIATENDTIEMSDGTIYVNDNIYDENYTVLRDNTNFYKRVVPKDNVFVLGDNRKISKDSRYSEFGFIPIKDIIGKVIILK